MKGSASCIGNPTHSLKEEFEMKRQLNNSIRWSIVSLTFILMTGLFATEQIAARQLRTATTIVDLNGDGQSDMMLFDSENGQWFSYDFFSGVVNQYRVGSPDSRQIIGDYDGDGISDFAVTYDNAFTNQKMWHLELSGKASEMSEGAAALEDFAWGQTCDVPVPADYDGDGRTDVATFCPRTGLWNIFLSGSRQERVDQLGIGSDNLVPSDYDGDGMADVAVMRVEDSTWYVHYSKDDSLGTFTWDIKVTCNDVMVPADYDGDGLSDMSMYRVSSGYWVILESASGNYRTAQFGGGVYSGDSAETESSEQNADLPMPGDFDGDGVLDIAVWNSKSKVAHVLPSQSSIMASMPVGTDTSKPVSLSVTSR
jgi:hypothetical protein